jgi:hypothetical protein
MLPAFFIVSSRSSGDIVRKGGAGGRTARRRASCREVIMQRTHVKQDGPGGGGSVVPEPVRRELYGRWIADQWSDVHVCDAEMVARVHRGTGQRGTLRAVVQLGGLAPADVVVTARSADESLERASVEVVRLWSVQSHHNGAYVFEAAANARAIDESASFLVTVEPARTLPGDRVLASAMRLVASSRPDDRTTCTPM